MARKRYPTKVNKDGTIELGTDFVEAFQKVQKAQIDSIQSMLDDQSPMALAAKQMLNSLAAAEGEPTFESFVQDKLNDMRAQNVTLTSRKSRTCKRKR